MTTATERDASIFRFGASELFDRRWIVALLAVILAWPAAAQELRPKPSGIGGAIDRGLAFLAKDALAWRSDHNCVSCHHAALVIWSMHEANQRGHAIDAPFLAEFTKWVAESGDGKTGVPRPANVLRALNTKAVYFALALEADPRPDTVSQAGLQRLLNTVESDQTDNGSWASWPDTRPPIFGNSDESMTALATLAVLPLAASGDEAAKAVRDKGIKWLAETKTDDDP